MQSTASLKEEETSPAQTHRSTVVRNKTSSKWKCHKRDRKELKAKLFTKLELLRTFQTYISIYYLLSFSVPLDNFLFLFAANIIILNSFFLVYHL